MKNTLILAGILLILLGFFTVMAGILLQATEKHEGDVRGGAIIFIGPIPIAFGTDRGSLLVVSILMLILMAAAWFLLSGR